jgi:NAD(P)-dependent dehydrogenase (short-subunit alcohol dehydrogenase family)
VGSTSTIVRKQIIESQGGFATGRFTRQDEVADLVLLLASDRAGNVTGWTLSMTAA